MLRENFRDLKGVFYLIGTKNEIVNIYRHNLLN